MWPWRLLPGSSGAAWRGSDVGSKFLAWAATRSSSPKSWAGADANVGFDALRALLRHLGFEERTRSSHHVFRRAGVDALINLQRDGDKAKVYQVRQVRAVLIEYGLTGGAPPEPTEGR